MRLGQLIRNLLELAVAGLLLVSPAAAEETVEGLLETAVHHTFAHEPEKALATAQAARRLAEATADLPGQAQAAILQAVFENRLDDEAGALRTLDAARAHLKAVDDPLLSWIFWNLEGAILRAQDEHEAARERFLVAFELTEKLEAGDRLVPVNSFRFFAAAQGVPPEILEMDQFLPVVKSLLMILMKATALLGLAEVDRDLENFEAALAHVDRAFEIGEPLFGLFDGELLNTRGSILEKMGRDDEAAKDYEKALRAVDFLPNSDFEMDLLEKLLVIDLKRSPREETLSRLERLVELARLSESSSRQTYDHRLPGMLLSAMGRWDEAYEHFQTSLTAARDSGDVEEIVFNLNLMGNLLLHRNQTEEALRLLREAEDLAKGLEDPQIQALIQTNLARCYVLTSLPEQALPHALRSLELAETLEDASFKNELRMSLAFIYVMAEKLRESRKQVLTCLASFRRNRERSSELEALVLLAHVEIRLGRHEEAREIFEVALALSEELRRPDGELMARLGLGLIALQYHEPGEALMDLERVATLSDDLGLDVGRSIAHAGFGTAAFQEGRTEATIDHFDQATELIERLWKDRSHAEAAAGFAASARLLHESAMYLAIRLKQPVKAFHHAEKARARAFLNRLGSAPVALERSVDDELRSKERELRQEISRLEQQLEQHSSLVASSKATIALGEALRRSREEYRGLLLEIKEKHPEYGSLISVDTLDVSQIQHEVLDGQTSLVAFFVPVESATGSFPIQAWVIDKDDVTRLSLDLDSLELREKIDHLNDLIRARDFNAELAAELHRHLVAPLEPLIDHRNLILIPHGVLHDLPFAALRNAETGRFLIEDYALSTAPSASILRYLVAKRSPFEGRILVLGNPDGSLPESEAEATAVARLFGAEPWLGPEARESRLRQSAGKIDLLHIAAHSRYVPSDPFWSRLELAPGDGDDGRLVMHEIFNLDLSGTNLVVLSACETALGQRDLGDDLQGLKRAFLYAGSPSVVTSLWRIDDAASAVLMERFYTHLQGGRTLAEALRRAQLDVLSEERWREPYFWAAFVLTGDGGSFYPSAESETSKCC